MSDIYPLAKRIKRWSRASAVFGAIGVACGLMSISVFFWPNIPREPRPESGNVFPINYHGTTIYWTQTEVWAQRWLASAGVLLFVVGWSANQHVKSMEKLAEAEAIRRQMEEDAEGDPSNHQLS